MRIEPLWTKSERKLNDSLAIIGIASALYDDVTGWPKLARALNQALLGDGSLLLELSDEYSGRSQTGKYFSNENDIAPIINCLDWPNSFETVPNITTYQKFVTVAPIFGPFLAANGIFCKYLLPNVIHINSNLNIQVTSRVMIIGTTRDPATPNDWAIALSRKFPNSILLIFDSDGHTGMNRGNKCVDTFAESYLFKLTATRSTARFACNQAQSIAWAGIEQKTLIATRHRFVENPRTRGDGIGTDPHLKGHRTGIRPRGGIFDLGIELRRRTKKDVLFFQSSRHGLAASEFFNFGLGQGAVQ